MNDDRRMFLQQAALTGFFLSPLATRLDAMMPAAPEAVPTAAADTYDTQWPKRLTGKHKAVYDCPDIASGLGVIRAALVAGQYRDVLKVKPADISNVIVLRHDGIWLAMNQACWDAYGVGATRKVTHPMTEEPITKNPALLGGGTDGVPAAFALPAQIAAGTIVLACAFAFQDVVGVIAKADKLSATDASAKAQGMVIPGIIMQPSGVFATTYAQEHGCVYVRAT